MESKKKETWSSLLSFILVSAGAAIGLGNIWKFPYMAGKNGGSAFVLCYIFFVFAIAAPVMMAEFFIGKEGQKNTFDSFLTLAKKNNLSAKWSYTGFLGIVTLFLVFCFYSVVAGFSIAYIFYSLRGDFIGKNAPEIQAMWGNLLVCPVRLTLISALFIFLTVATVAFGIKKGLETSCKIMMPALFGLLLFLVGYGFYSGGFYEAFTFLFSFNPQALSASVVLDAMGHAFFTLAVGAGAMIAYGAYLPKNAKVSQSVVVIALLDLLIALLSGLAIFPIIFSHDLSPAQGPGLMFLTMPVAFASMPMGSFIGLLFFVLLFLAALSSSLSFAEPLVFFLEERFNFSRVKGSISVFFATLLGSIICCLSFNKLAWVRIFGKFSLFDFVADVSTNLFLPLGALCICLFAAKTIKFENHQAEPRKMFLLWKKAITYFVPWGILLVFLSGVYSFFVM